MSAKVVVTDGSSTREVPLDGTVVVGRDPLCAIYADDPLLSRRHAELLGTPFGARVRDLGSQNGIRVNGVPVTELLLQPGDVVEIASLTLRVIDDTQAASERQAPVRHEATALMTGPPAAVAPQPRASASSESTVVMTRPPAMPAAGAPPVSVATPAEIHPSTPREAQDRPEPGEGQRGSPAAVRARRGPRWRPAAWLPWTARVILTSCGLSALIAAAGFLPSLWSHNQRISGATTLRAATLARWLAADAARDLEAGRSITGVTDTILDQPGVMDALVVSPDGRVLAPASRRGQAITTFSALGLAPADVDGQRVAASDGYMHVARPVAVSGNARAAVVWLSIRRESVGRSLLSVALPLLLAGLIGIGGGWLLCRSVTRALGALNDDLDGMLAGQLERVGDPLQTRPTSALTETLNYLVTRLRATTKGDLRRARGEGSGEGDSLTAEPAMGEPGGSRAEAGPASPGVRLVANAQLRIVEASAGCEALLGVSSGQMLGQHLIDALPDATLVDAILQGLSQTPAAGETHLSTSPGGTTGHVLISVSRRSRDGSLTILLRDAETRPS